MDVAESSTKGSATVKSKSSSSASRNLWVSGLSSITRATDLKIIFSKYGKVIGAKVVTNTRTPGTRCYGYVTMGSSSDASKCIEHLHRTELHGRIISVERAKSDISGVVKPSPAAGKTDSPKATADDDTSAAPVAAATTTNGNATTTKGSTTADRKRTAATTDKDAKKEEKDCKNAADSTAADDTKKKRPVTAADRKPVAREGAAPRQRITTRSSRERADAGATVAQPQRRPAPNKPRVPVNVDREREVLSFQKIREERERQRLRERERKVREEERLRTAARRRQREEEDRLVRERERLKKERLRLEREKADLLRLERERQKLEREKIELERLELKRQQLKYEFYSLRTNHFLFIWYR